MASIIISVFVPLFMLIGWLIHIAVYWHWDFKAWYHDSDNDF